MKITISQEGVNPIVISTSSASRSQETYGMSGLKLRKVSELKDISKDPKYPNVVSKLKQKLSKCEGEDISVNEYWKFVENNVKISKLTDKDAAIAKMKQTYAVWHDDENGLLFVGVPSYISFRSCVLGIFTAGITSFISLIKHAAKSDMVRHVYCVYKQGNRLSNTTLICDIVSYK